MIEAPEALIGCNLLLLQQQLLQSVCEMLLCSVPLLWVACASFLDRRSSFFEVCGLRSTAGDLAFCGRCPRFTSYAVATLAAEMPLGHLHVFP